MHGFAATMGEQALVLREKVLSNQGPLYVRLVGRKKGIWAWFLTLIGIDVTTVFEVYDNRIEFSKGSISGTLTTIIPLSNISNMVVGRFRPAVLFVVAAILILVGLLGIIPTAGLSLILWIVAIIPIVKYILNKTVCFVVVPNSAVMNSVIFKRSIIENQNISEEEAKAVVAIITELLSRSNGGYIAPQAAAYAAPAAEAYVAPAAEAYAAPAAEAYIAPADNNIQ